MLYHAGRSLTHARTFVEPVVDGYKAVRLVSPKSAVWIGTTAASEGKPHVQTWLGCRTRGVEHARDLRTGARGVQNPINAYRVSATAKNLERLALAGFDVTEGRRGRTVEIYGTAGQMRKLRADTGTRARLVRDRRGRTVAQRSARIARAGLAKARASQATPYTGSDAAYKVWRRYDRVPADGKEQYLELYDRLTQQSIVKRVDIGDSVMGRDIIALKVTRNAKSTRDSSRPAVLYNAMQHAREWLAGETCRRTLLYFTQNYGKDPRVTRLVDTRELWFVCVNNPDGYEYTFTPGNRLWRKNMADNDRDGIRGEVNDGVDPNRNFPVNWGLDDEGSSPDPSSETYRGPEPYVPEPETRAMLDLWNRVDFEFEKNDHTAAELILYPQGWQMYTPAADDAIFTALAGDDRNPAIAGFDPDLGAELYITNGDTLDTAYNRENILAYTPEGSVPQDPSVSGFEFEDSEAAIENEFKRHRAFSIDLAESADDPASPDSHLGNTVEPFYIDAFADSYGDPQPVQVTAKRSLGALVMRYRINGGATKTVGTTEWSDGERYYQEAGVYYHRMRGDGDGHEAGRLRGGLVRPEERVAALGLVHLLRAGGDRQPRAGAGGRGLHRTDADAGSERAEVRRDLPRGARRPTASAPTSTTWTPAAGAPRIRWACSRTTTPWSGTRATTT